MCCISFGDINEFLEGSISEEWIRPMNYDAIKTLTQQYFLFKSSVISDLSSGLSLFLYLLILFCESRVDLRMSSFNFFFITWGGGKSNILRFVQTVKLAWTYDNVHASFTDMLRYKCEHTNMKPVDKHGGWLHFSSNP